MTSIVMISGMIPMAFGAAQTAPLAIAVIGGLIASTADHPAGDPVGLRDRRRKIGNRNLRHSIPTTRPVRYYDGAMEGSHAM